jgi:outer membrane biosynthesis protein TonB
MKNGLTLIFILLILLLQACGIHFPNCRTVDFKQTIETEVTDKEAEEPAKQAVTEPADAAAIPAPAAVPEETVSDEPADPEITEAPSETDKPIQTEKPAPADAVTPTAKPTQADDTTAPEEDYDGSLMGEPDTDF